MEEGGADVAVQVGGLLTDRHQECPAAELAPLLTTTLAGLVNNTTRLTTHRPLQNIAKCWKKYLFRD